MTALTLEERRGRALLLTGFAVALFGDICITSALIVPRVGFGPMTIASVIRWLFTAALLFAIWRGHRWARWLIVGLFTVGFLLVVRAILRVSHPLLVAVAVHLGLTVVLLAFPSSVSAFIRYQRLRYSGGT
jgi:hypothetical protein